MTMDTATEEMLTELDYMGWNAQQREKGLQLLAVAQERGDEDLEFAVRMRLTANGVMCDVSDLALANFAWCAAKHKEDPARFFGDPDSDSDQIFWHYKWMPGIITGSPVFDLAQLEDVFADFEATYRAAGLPLSAIVTGRLDSAVETGNLEAATVAAAELDAMPRDRFSSCEACVPSSFVDFELMRGDGAAAVKRAVDSWRAGNTCAEEPESMLAGILIEMLRVDHPDVEEAYDEAYGASRHRAEGVAANAECAAFASVTGNHELAFQMLERHLVDLAQDALGERKHFAALTNFAVVLDRFAAARPDLAGALVRGSADPRLTALLPATDEVRGVSEMSAVMWDAAAEIGARFDARNGNDMYANRLANAKALVNEEHPLDLGEPQEFSPISIRPAEPSTPSEFVARAVASVWASDHGEAFIAARGALERADELTPDELARAAGILRSSARELDDPQLAENAANAYLNFIAMARGDEAAAMSEAAPLGSSAEQFEAAIDAHPDVHPLQLANVHMLAVQALMSQEGGPSEEEIARAGAHIEAALALTPESDPSNRASVLYARSQFTFAGGDSEAAFADLATAAQLPVPRTALAANHQLRGHFLGRLEEPAAAAQEFDASSSLFAAAGFDGASFRRAIDAAQAWQDADASVNAVARFDYAQSLLGTDGEMPASLRWQHAVCLVDAQMGPRAVPLLERILADELAAGDVEPGSLAQTYANLGKAYDQSFDSRAAEHYVRASELFAEAGGLRPAAEMTIFAGRELIYQEQREEALAVLERGLAFVASEPEPILEYELLFLTAGARGDLARSDWREPIERAIEVARAIEDGPRVLRAMTTRQAILSDQDPAAAAQHGVEGIEFALTVDQGEEAVGLLWMTAQAVQQVRGEDAAVELLESYRARAAEFSDGKDSLAQMGAELLEEWDREALAELWFEMYESED